MATSLSAANVIHLVNPLSDDTGGADWRTIETWRLLKGYFPTRLWSEYRPAPKFAENYPVQRIVPWRFAFPRGGTLVFVGTYFRIGHWVRFAAPRRVALIYNTLQPDRLRKNLRRIASCGRTAEVVYTSLALRQREQGHGPILQSPIDLARFAYHVRDRRRPFTVGRFSRDIASKHHPDDVALWRALAAEGMRVRIMGGTCLAHALGDIPNIELLPAGAEDPVSFLQSLDCFLYRTADSWFEAFGRVVFEAMATGLPVVCGEHGGYAEALTAGRDALVFSRHAEALAAVRGLRDQPDYARDLGAQARRTTVSLNCELPRRTLELLAPPATMLYLQSADGCTRW